MVGPLDIPMAGVAKTLIGTFSQVKKQFSRSVTTFDPRLNTEVVVTDQADLLTSPFSPFEKGIVGKNFSGQTVLGTDLMTVVARLDAEAENFDMSLTTEVVMAILANGVLYSVLAVQEYGSGDLIAAYGLLLRK